MTKNYLVEYSNSIVPQTGNDISSALKETDRLTNFGNEVTDIQNTKKDIDE